MDGAQVAALRTLLAQTGWIERTAAFARALRRTQSPGGLLVVGPPDDEPWHLTAHLDSESRMAGLPEISPTLIRWAPQPGAPRHLAVGMDRLEQAARGETLFVVSAEPAPAPLLERVNDARKIATVLALDQGDPELELLAHESLAVEPGAAPMSFDAAQHLVSSAAGQRDEGAGRGLRQWLGRILDTVSGPAGA
ncbi:MAG TPA: hypothetical protein VG253_12450 [Streptosporangiaceae bacterium]|jgi:hypothetical protein|nr:hypothetical protein [Streptosporangiaceae bacterium]